MDRIKIFVINLHYDTDRRKFMQEQLEALKISYEIIPATVGKNLSSEVRNEIYDEKLSLQENGYTLSNTQIACADSHRRIYQKIISENLPWALVLEDDVLIDSRIKEILNDDFINKSGADWIQIDYVPANYSYIKNWLHLTLRQEIPLHKKALKLLFRFPIVISWAIYETFREYLYKNRKPNLAWFARPLYLASAYVITNKGARKIISLTEPIRFAADSLQNIAPKKVGLKITGVIPLLTNQQREKFVSNLIYDN